ncbi:hypothetical protein D3C72_1423730 [compost metagenome]
MAAPASTSVQALAPMAASTTQCACTGRNRRSGGLWRWAVRKPAKASAPTKAATAMPAIHHSIGWRANSAPSSEISIVVIVIGAVLLSVCSRWPRLLMNRSL